jgi:N-acetylmuramoyl-L-alanine amidase
MKIAVDAGHGMSNATPGVYDPGAVVVFQGETFAEADVTLRYALSLKFLISEKNIPTFMSRTSSADDAPLAARASRAEEAECTHFISLHLNAAGPTARGVEVLYRRNADKALAAKACKLIAQSSGLKERGAKKRLDLAVLKFSNGPRLLIELGFLTNKHDRELLLSGRPMRVSICKAIMEALAIDTTGLA